MNEILLLASGQQGKPHDGTMSRVVGGGREGVEDDALSFWVGR